MSIVLGGNDGDNDNDLLWPDNCKLTFFNVKISKVNTLRISFITLYCIEECLKYGKQEPQLSRVATISKIMITVCDSVRAGSSS